EIAPAFSPKPGQILLRSLVQALIHVLCGASALSSTKSAGILSLFCIGHFLCFSAFKNLLPL
ncbi:MAG: hypothetical protein ACI4O4_05685, partial [Candidatus Ventricola sp.]